MIQHRIKEREPQYMDMKEIITEAARKLVLEKKVKKLTVKDIVEGCGLTRQTFYRNFKDKYDLINWYFDKLAIVSFRQMGVAAQKQR